MIIYKDILTGDEMFSDIYKIKESANGVIIEVEGKMVSRSGDEIDDALIGGNASLEELCEGTESNVVTGVDIILNHKLSETSFTKETYKTYIKDYMKAVRAKLKENNPGREKEFVTGAQVEIKNILGSLKDYQFFTGESMNPDGMIGLLNYRDDGITPFMIFFRDGLEIEKC